MGGDASIDTEVAGNKVNVAATVNNGYLESISGTLEGPVDYIQLMPKE